MSGRTARGAQPPPASNRQNEYFVPRDGIDREVITADICRYLGNDALVRPGVYENPQTTQVVQGYFITAYRNLTTAMIEDLKADSARWDQERRQQTSRTQVQVQYRNSDTHQSRQYYGPTEASGGAAFPDSNRESYDGGAPRYPGTGNQGYTGASAPYQTQQFGIQGGYSGQPGYGNAPPQQFSQSSADSYPGGAPMSAGGYGQPPVQDRPYALVGANLDNRRPGPDPQYGAGDPYQTGPRERIPTSSMAQGRPTTFVTSGAPQQGYTSSSGSAFYGQNASSASSQFAAVQPTDPFYGRGNPNYGSSHDQYETAPPPRTSAPSSSSQMPTSGATSSRRENRESAERTHGDSRQRHSHRSR